MFGLFEPNPTMLIDELPSHVHEKYGPRALRESGVVRGVE